MHNFFIFIKFNVVGLISTLIHLISSLFVFNYFSFTIYESNFYGFIFAFIFSFLFHNYWTFKINKFNINVLIRFLTTSACLYLLSNLSLLLSIKYFNSMISLLISSIIFALFSFFIHLNWSFK
jgi:putative flippase GtrA